MSRPLAGAAGVVDRDPVTAWLLLVLAATTLQVGDNGLPAEHLGGGGEARWPFLVVVDLPGGSMWGGLAGAGTAVGFTYLVSAVGLRGDQARSGRDAAVRAVTGRAAESGWYVSPPDPAGLHVVERELDSGTPDGGLDAEGVEPNKRWTAQTRFRIHVETGS